MCCQRRYTVSSNSQLPLESNLTTVTSGAGGTRGSTRSRGAIRLLLENGIQLVVKYGRYPMAQINCSRI